MKQNSGDNGMSIKHWRNLSESAIVLGVSRPTLYKMIRNGQLRPSKIGAKPFLSLIELRPHIIHKCSTCYKRAYNYCYFREGKGCPDWHSKV